MRNLGYYLRYLRPQLGLLIFLLAGTAVAAMLTLPMSFLPTVLTRNFDDLGYFYGYLWIVFACMSVGWVLGVGLSYGGAKLGETLVRSMRKDAIDRLESLSMLSVFSQGPGEFVQQVDRDVHTVREAIVLTFVQSARQIATGIAVFVSMMVLETLASLAIVAVLVAMWGIIRWANGKVERLSHTGRELSKSITGRLVEYLGGFRDLVASGKASRFTGKFDEMLTETAQVNVRTAVWAQAAQLVPSIVVSLAMLAVYSFGVRQVDTVEEVGVIVTYASLVGQLFPAVIAAAQWTNKMAMSAPSMRGLRRILDTPPQVRKSGERDLTEAVRSIEFDHVTFELNGRRITDDMSFTIPGGKMTALVGQSGAGKTTVFHLLLRLLEPTGGRILLNGEPCDSFTLSSLRRHVGFIPQRPFIFNLSLRENLLLAAPDNVSPEALDQAIEISQLREVIERRRDQGGLESSGGYLGNQLAGGEQQRIALARLILQDPEVIICDEYTANVDVRTAKVIHEAMRHRFAGRTRVVITHELYTIRGADLIVVLDKGRVVDSGTHDELVSRPGLYKAMWEVQTME